MRTQDFLRQRSIAGRVAIVTGAASGIGAACAKVLSLAGALVVVSDIDEAGANRVAKGIVDQGGSAWGLKLDTGDETSIHEAVATTVATHGGIDILINNAGINRKVEPGSASFDQVWERSLAVMLTGPKTLINTSLPHLKASNCARIINIASIEGLSTAQHNSPYAAAKAGILGLTRALAVDLGDFGITVNAICPGPILTGMTEGLEEELKAQYLDRYTILKRAGRPEEVAHMVLNLCLPSSGFVTGASVIVDGGLMARSS